MVAVRELPGDPLWPHTLTRQVTLVCGPPCSGKSTFVAEHAGPRDRVVDIDTLARKAGSPRLHGHDGRYYKAAGDEFWRLCEQIGQLPHVTAWVLRGAPEPAARHKLATTLDATRVVVLLPTFDTAYTRALARDTAEDGGALSTCKAVSSWFRRYRPSALDEVLNIGPED